MHAADHLTASACKRGESAVGAVAQLSLARRLIALARAALPQQCALCGAHAGGALVCAACEASLPRVAGACPLCGLPSPQSQTCGACIACPPPFAATLAPYVYAFPVDRLLQALKYGGRLALADWAAQALASTVARKRVTIDAIVALPLAAPRQRGRGFNQAQEIARHLAARLELPLLAALARTSSGAPQAMLPLAARASNVRGAFACVADVRGLRLAIVDDVMTTGATIGEAARTLADAGASRVDAWVVARTLVT